MIRPIIAREPRRTAFVEARISSPRRHAARMGADHAMPAMAPLLGSSATTPGEVDLVFSSDSPFVDFAAVETHLPSFKAAIELRCGTHLPLTSSSAYSLSDMLTV